MATDPKRDLVKELGAVYKPGRTPELIDVPPQRFLMIDGIGDPNTSQDYEAAVSALYSLAYSAKFAVKKAGGEDAKVAPLEGLWSAPGNVYDPADKSGWEWTMMIAVPDSVTAAVVESVSDKVAAKVGADVVARVRLDSLHEGQAAQVLYVGPYADEAPTIQALHAFIAEHGLQPTGRHHEIYLSDPRRSAPEKLKTIIRQPAEQASG